jgi:hypothetical protein
MPHYTLTLTGRLAIVASAALILVGFIIGRLT